MLIDWSTVFFQAANFLILVGLLKHFLYDRIIQAMDRREEDLTARFDEAEQRKKEAAKERNEYQQKVKELENQRRTELAKARDEAEKKRKELIRQAREEADILKDRWQETVRREQDAFLRRLRQMTREHVFQITRRALKDLADQNIERRAVDCFLERLADLSPEETKDITQWVRDGNGVIVRSSFSLQKEQQQQIIDRVQNMISTETKIRFETDPQLILGIELAAPGRKAAFSLDTYLGNLEEKARSALEAVAGRPEKRESESNAGK